MAPSMASGPSYPYSHSSVMPAPTASQQYGGYMAPGMGRSLGKQGVSSELLNVNPPDNVQVPVTVQVPVIPIVKEPSSGMSSQSSHGLVSLLLALA